MTQDPTLGATFNAVFPYFDDAIRLLRHRVRLGLTQGAYANRLRVRRSAVEKWESGTYPVPPVAFR